MSEETVTASTADAVDDVLAALLNHMQPLEEAAGKKLKMLVFGDPDAGKTSFGATASNNLVIDADRGLTSVFNRPDTVGKNIKVFPYINFGSFEKVIEYLNMGNPEFEWVEVVTIDTLSELHKKGLAEVTERDFRLSPINNRYKAETDQHAENNEHIRRIVSSLKDLDRNLIILAHSRMIEPKGQDARIFPDFSEKLAKSIVALVDICVYIEKREVDGVMQRVFRFHTPENIMTKCRVGTLPAEAVDVTWDKVWENFQKHLANLKREGIEYNN